MSDTMYHVSLDVAAAVDWPDRELIGLIGDEEGRKYRPRLARAILQHALDSGEKFIPFCDCDNFDPHKGCLGHPPDVPASPRA